MKSELVPTFHSSSGSSVIPATNKRKIVEVDENVFIDTDVK